MAQTHRADTHIETTFRPGESAYLVLRQLRPLYQASGHAVDQALQGTGLSTPLRAVLEVLATRGPMTAPQLAREFGVTRQSIQAIVDDGSAGGFVEFKDNPQHRRSRLVTATELGEQSFDQVHQRELTNLHRVTADLNPGDLARCASVLAVLTERMRQLHDRDQEPQ